MTEVLTMRTIDVDDLGVGRCSKDVLPAAYCAGWNGLLGLVEKAPTVDAVPVVHGRWISFLDGDHIMPERYYRCSRCGRVESRRQPYCHCGAKMDGGDNTER